MSKQRRAAPQQQPTAWNETAWSPSSSSEPTVGAGGRVAAACGWEWALSALWNPDVDKKCVVNVTDTILFGTHYTNHINGSAKRRPEFLWLTTQKNGAITRKKLKPGASADVPPIAEIQERFVRLASKWSATGGATVSGAQHIAVLRYRDGSRRLLSPGAFQEWLDALEIGSSAVSSDVSSVASLQAYIPSQGVSPYYLLATYESSQAASSEAATASPWIDVECRDGHFHAGDGKIHTGARAKGDVSSRIRKDVELATQTIVKFIRWSTNIRVKRAVLEFVLDGEQRLWLTHIEHVEVEQKEVKIGEEQTLTGSIGPRKQSLPNLHGGAQGMSTSGETGAKCRGEFCRVRPSLLPGLFCTREPHLEGSSDDNESNNEDEATEKLDLIPDTGQRFKIGNNNVQLAHAEMDFILGKVTGCGTSEPALRWQEADNVFRMELGRTNPTQFYKQVLVCINCHRVYSELNRFRDNGFLKAGENRTPRHGMKQNLSAITLKTKIKASATKQPKDSDIRTADPSSDYYDQLFLAELAKHDGEPGSEVHDDDSQNQNRLIADTSSQYRPEFDDVSARPQSGNSSKSERGCLPSLNTASVPVVKSKKKTSSTPSVSGNAHIRGNNNNQGAGPFPDDDEIRNSSTKVRIAKLEDELAQVRTKLAMSESQKHQLEQKCLQTQSQCTAMLQEKDDQVRKQLLEMEVVYHTKQSNQKPQSNGSEPKSSSADEITKLIETIDSLSFQIDQINVEKDHEKKQLSQSHQLDIKRLHEKYQLDMEALRLSEHSAKEQVETIQLQMFNLQNQAQIATTQAKNAKAALEDLTKNKLASLEEKNHRLERQLADARSNLQLKGGAAASSTLAQSSTFTSAQELEALEKHMSNKIDYLKAQLASEMKCKEELGSHLAQITNTMEQMKKERKQALAEQEETFKRQIQRMESTFAQEKDVMASQQAALQGKLVTLQANVTDLVQELTLWKSKEANAKLSMEKMVEENVRLTRQIVDLENQVEALMEERKHDNGNTSMSVKSANDETQRMQMEALLRRLDNERQYLKNQLENEQEMKEKSQKQVSNLQNEVDELKQMLEQVAKESEMKLSALAAEKLSADQQFQESIECLEESKLLLSRQFKEVQVKFSQAREQSLFDRDELEKMRIETNEMRSQLLASKENIAKEKEYGRNTSERSSKALMLVKNSLKAVEEEKNIRIQRLEDENGIYMKKLANTQAEMLVLEEKWIADKARVKKQHALTQLALIWKAKLSAWCMKQQFRSFHRLELSNRVYQVQSSLARTHNAEIEDLEERLTTNYMNKCDEITQNLHEERIEALRQVKELHDNDREELCLYYEQEKSQLQEELTFAHDQHTKELEEKYNLKYKSLEEYAAKSIQDLQTKYESLKQEKEAITEALAETQRRCEQLSGNLDSQASESRKAWEAKEKLWRSEKEGLKEKYEQDFAAYKAETDAKLEDLLQHHDAEVKNLEEEFAQTQASAVEKAVDDMKASAQAQYEAQLEAHQQQMVEEQALHKSQMGDEIEQIDARWQREIQREREMHEKQLRDALERVESRAQSQLDALQKEMNERKGHAVVQCTSKWQKALEELQERLEVEKKVAYDNGLQDRENEWQQAAIQIKQKQKEELENVQSEALRAIQAAEERHKLQFQAKCAQLKREFEELHTKDIQRLAGEITKREQENARVAFEGEKEKIEQEKSMQHAQELEQLRDQYQRERESELNKLLEGMGREKQELLEQFAVKGKELVDQEKEWMERLNDMALEKENETQKALAAVRSELLVECDHATEQLREALTAEMETKLKEQEVRLLNEQDDAIAQVQEDSEKLIEQVELAMTQLKTQKEAMEKELIKLRNAVEEAEDSHFDLEEQMKKQRKQMTFHFLTLLMHAKKRMGVDQHSHLRAMTELQTKQNDLESAHTRDKKTWANAMAQLQTTWSGMQEKHDEMLKTLTNYKRDELVAHRSASGVLSNEIAIVTKQMEEVQEMRAGLENEIEQLQAEAHAVEASLRQLMVSGTSASLSASSHGDGSSAGLNMAVVAKKRRLNEEFEALLEQIEKKKAEVRNVEKTFTALHVRKEEKEHEMKVMERKLVEILVQQQKQMLALLTSVRELRLAAPVPWAATT